MKPRQRGNPHPASGGSGIPPRHVCGRQGRGVRLFHIPPALPSPGRSAMRMIGVCVSLALLLGAATVSSDEPKVVNTEPAHLQPVTPKEALAKIKVPEGFRVTLFAGEPDICQPIAMAVDHRG